MLANQRMMIFGFSELIRDVLRAYADKKFELTVYLLEGRPNCEGYRMYKELEHPCITRKLIADVQMGIKLEEVDYVLIGAEAVSENGGIVNQAGTFSLALCAKNLEKPLYVLAESFKLFKIWSLSQRDLPEQVKNQKLADPVSRLGEGLEGVKLEVTTCDYTPPDLISVIVTDARIMKPTAISDELLQMFTF